MNIYFMSLYVVLLYSFVSTHSNFCNQYVYGRSRIDRQISAKTIHLSPCIKKKKIMIHRNITLKMIQLAQQFPVVALLGPRKSGKTTLAQTVFPKYSYVSLENFDTRRLTNADPRKFLDLYHNEHGIILDEIQHAPELLSYIKTVVDRTQKNGSFILISSQNFLLNPNISQSLAGRIAIFTLLPLAMSELNCANKLSTDSNVTIFQGSYPSLYSKDISPTNWYRSYVEHYIGQEVRQIKNIYDLEKFHLFMKLCAGRIGQILNMSSLANDCGVSVGTVQAWLSVLQASYVIFLLQPHFKNFSKRLVKTPKLYFYDTGLASFLLELDNPKQLATHYLRGGLFESYIISELIKLRYNAGCIPHYYFWRDKLGHEVDCIIDHGGKSFPVEIKSGQTINQDYFEGLYYWSELAQDQAGRSYCIYTGSESQNRTKVSVLKWQDLTTIKEIFE